MKITLPIGFRFVNGSGVYEVVPDENSTCEGCAFFRDKQCLLLEQYGIVCSAASRGDNCNVVFKLVGFLSRPD